MPAARRTTNWSQMWRDFASPELSAALAGIGAVRRLADGELLYQQGEMGHELYGVKAGMVALTMTTRDGAAGLVGLYSAGTWFGEVTLFDDLPRPVSAHARGPAEVLVVSARRLRELLDAHPLWYRDFARVLCNKLRLAMLHYEVSYLPISVRLCLRLLDLAATFGEAGPAGLEIRLKLSQETLAQMLALTRQSVNKELVALERRGWLKVRRAGLVVLDPPAILAHVREHGSPALLAGLEELYPTAGGATSPG